VCNVNADDAAAGLAAGLGARQLVLMTDVDGVRDASGRKLESISAAEAEALIADGTIRGGMVPKVKAALKALAWDDAEAIISDGSAPGALVRSLEDPSFGTRVSTRGHAAAG
jgi:acetylglutamate kinase